MTQPACHNGTKDDRIRLSIEFSRSLLENIDEMRKAWGMRSRGATIERILLELFEPTLEDETLEDES